MEKDKLLAKALKRLMDEARKYWRQDSVKDLELPVTSDWTKAWENAEKVLQKTGFTK